MDRHKYVIKHEEQNVNYRSQMVGTWVFAVNSVFQWV